MRRRRRRRRPTVNTDRSPNKRRPWRRRRAAAATVAPQGEKKEMTDLEPPAAAAALAMGTPERNKPKHKKRKRNKQERSPSAVSAVGAVEADKSGNVCTDMEGVQGDADVSMSPRNGEGAKCPEVSIAQDSVEGNKDNSQNCVSLQESSVQTKSRRGREKRKRRNSSSVQDSSSHHVACEAGLVTTADEDTTTVFENKKLKKKAHANKAVSVMTADENSAHVSMSPRNGEGTKCPEVSIAQDLVEGNKDNSQNCVSLQESSVQTKSRRGREKRKRRNSSSVQDSSSHHVACEDTATVFENKKLKKKARANEAVSVTTADEDTATVFENKKLKKKARADEAVSVTTADGDTTTVFENKKSNKKARAGESVFVATADEDIAPVFENKKSNKKAGAAESGLSTTTDEDSAPVFENKKSKDKVGTAEAGLATTADENSTPGFEDKKSKKKAGAAEAGLVTTAEENSTPGFENRESKKKTGAGEAGLVTTADENNTPGSENKKPEKNAGAGEAGLVTAADDNSTPGLQDNKLKKKRKRKRSGVTKAPLVDDASLAEIKDVGGTGSIGEMDVEVQPDLSEEDAKKFTKNMGSSICESDVTANNVSLVQGAELNPKAKRNGVHKKSIACSSTDHVLSRTGHPSSGQVHKEKVRNFYSLRGSLIRFRRKKLLILDLNGLLADINQDHHNAHMSHAKVRGKLVFKRPYYDDFLRFCFQNFELGIWSSRMKTNVDSVVNILMKDLKQNLLFCWDLFKCTNTGCKTLENQHKPLVLKELKKLWDKEDPDLPWEQGDFSPSNTLLVDDSPYKALGNPPHTAIFPHPYSYHNKKDDSLGPGGDLRMYLENLAAADDVQCYVREHPFGQPSIIESDPHWSFYVKILDKLENP